MSSPTAANVAQPRVLVIDDNPAIHEDFRKILAPPSAGATDIAAAESALFGDPTAPEVAFPIFEIDSAFQGEEGLAKVKSAVAGQRPYSIAFVDVRMPPGWDGIETLGHLWRADPNLQAVICTAYSDYSWEEMVQKLGRTDRLLILKKPFDTLEVHQIVCALLEKWNLTREIRSQMQRLETLVAERTEAVAHSLSLIQATLDSSADAILVINNAGQMVGLNKKFLSLWNLSRSEIESRHYQELVNAVSWQYRDPEAFQRKFSELLSPSESASFDLIESVNGRSFERYSQPQRLGDQVVGRVWSFRDVSDRRKTDQKIHEQASLIDLAQDAIVVRDLGHWITFWNKGAERLYGWTAEEAVGRQITDLLPADAETFRLAQDELLATGKWSGEVRHPTKDQAEVTISSRWTLVHDDDGHPKSVLAINSDITEKKKMESRLLRTQRIESIGTLASGVAHDLNNILSPIMISAPLLREGLSAREQETLIRNIEASAQRGSDIVRQLLTFARGVEGERLVVQLRHVVDELAKIARETFPRNITISSRVDPGLWPVIGDPTHIHQVLLNLCINARDALAQGGEITMTTENVTLDDSTAELDPDAKPGPYVRLRVADTGHGIPASVLDKIFDPFFTTKEHGKGTGLGLSTVLGIAKSHAGFVNVASVTGKGTTFAVYLPASPDAKEAPRDEHGKLPRGNGETILLVDDELGILDATRRLLESNGYKVVTASDGVAALSTYTRNRAEIKLVLTDIMMPVMDGTSLMRSLKKFDPNLKIVAISGMDQDSKAQEMKAMGLSAFLPKPFTAARVLNLLRDVLADPSAKPS